MRIFQCIRIGLLALLLAPFCSADAQTTGKLRMLVEPGGTYEFIVDHQFRMQAREVELTTGPHHFSFWAPERRIVDTTLVVEADVTKSVVIRLPYAQEFLVYNRDLMRYRRTMRAHRMLPLTVTAGAAVYTVLMYSKALKAKSQLDQDRTDYTAYNSPYRITVLKNQTIPEHKEAFRKAQRQYAMAGGITLACAGVTAYLFHRSGRMAAPEFHDSEKLRFDGLSYVPMDGGGHWVGGFTWNFAQ